jgi:two-component system sensor histidine kinase VicK
MPRLQREPRQGRYRPVGRTSESWTVTPGPPPARDGEHRHQEQGHHRQREEDEEEAARGDGGVDVGGIAPAVPSGAADTIDIRSIDMPWSASEPAMPGLGRRGWAGAVPGAGTPTDAHISKEPGMPSTELAPHVPDDLLRLAAHEMRSHLAVLNGYVAMLEDGSLGELSAAARKAVQMVRRKARALSIMVDDLLEEARYRDGRVHLTRCRVDLRTLVAQSVEEARLSLSDSDRHDLRLTAPADRLDAEVDPGRVQAIIRNLLDNAVKYSPQGGTVDVTLTADGPLACIAVTDQGIGLAPAAVEGIFERFRRGPQPAGAPGVAGVGLGLYISRTLARLHGGDVTAEPRPGGGSRFVLTLPRVLPGQPAEGAVGGPPHAPGR